MKEKELRTEYIPIKVSKTEFDILQKKATSLGLPISAFLRMTGLTHG